MKWTEAYKLSDNELTQKLKDLVDEDLHSLITVEGLKSPGDQAVLEENILSPSPSLTTRFVKLLGRKNISWGWYCPTKMRAARLVQLLSEDSVHDDE